MVNEIVERSKNENWTTSNLVAENLGKNHKHVLEKIRKLQKDLKEITVEVSTMQDNDLYKKSIVMDRKFIFEDYLADNGQTYERCKMNKPAFSLLMMTMSGKKVLRVLDMFNQAFYDMEKHILKLQNSDYKAVREQSKVARLAVTDSIKELVDLAVSQGSKNAQFYYSTVTKETYKALGFLAKGEKVGSNFRDHLDKFQIHELTMAEAWASRVIEQGIKDELHYKEIYLLAKQKVCEFGEAQDKLRLKE